MLVESRDEVSRWVRNISATWRVQRLSCRSKVPQSLKVLRHPSASLVRTTDVVMEVLRGGWGGGAGRSTVCKGNGEGGGVELEFRSRRALRGWPRLGSSWCSLSDGARMLHRFSLITLTC